MPLKLLCYIVKSHRKQMKFMDLVYHKYRQTRKVLFLNNYTCLCIYFVQICLVFTDPVHMITAHYRGIIIAV